MSFAGAIEMVDADRGNGLAKGALSDCALEGWQTILSATIMMKAVNFVIS